MSGQRRPLIITVSAPGISWVRQIIDERRASDACGSMSPYPWRTVVEAGAVISVSQIHELRSALTEPPFVQKSEYVLTYIDPLPALKYGDPIRLHRQPLSRSRRKRDLLISPTPACASTRKDSFSREIGGR